jgi:molybdopterin/thiamine biosynthesis adenylyltransferase
MSEQFSKGDTIDLLLREKIESPSTWSQPHRLDLSSPDDQARVEDMIRIGQIDKVIDRLDIIAEDLHSYHNPGSKVDNDVRRLFVDEVTRQGIEFGTWFYFPWDKKIVHYPDEQTHRKLLTSRNRNLITDQEQQLLYGSTVAVFGLSVGSNVVEEIVLSGIGGNLVIGDPDHVEPSNLNRIRAGFSDVGSHKLDRIAIRISERDPYIKQVHFREGIDHDSVEELSDFLPDIIFDEVDDIRTKVALRLFAKEKGIPLVMVTDLGDKSIIDIERHDQENVAIFGGRLKQETINSIVKGDLDNDSIRRLTVKIVGIRHITPRLIESVMRVGDSLPGLPQLGMTASMGGSMAAFSAREILLGRKLATGRYIVSPKDILNLSSPTPFVIGAKTVMAFMRSQNNKK